MITKNRQTRETILSMAKAAFPEKTVCDIVELTEGMCNVTYRIAFSDGEESILKIASQNDQGHTSNEIRLMQAEVEAMGLVKKHTSIPVARVQYADFTKTLCTGDYFFMEKVPGVDFRSLRGSMPQPAQDQIDGELGRIARELSFVRNPRFGFLGDEKRYGTLGEFVEVMLKNLLHDASARHIDILLDSQAFLALWERGASAFSEVREASLVHWDMWEGNVFVQDGHVSGIIDWERAIWGEPFMDDRFRRHTRRQAFLKGFGQERFSENEKTRLFWYDVILYLTMMIEVFYREFEDQGQYTWARSMLTEVLEERQA